MNKPLTLLDVRRQRQAKYDADFAASQQAAQEQLQKREVQAFVEQHPEVGVLIKNGQAAYYTFIDGLYAENTCPKKLLGIA